MNTASIALVIAPIALLVSALMLLVAWRGLVRSAHHDRDEEIRNAKRDAIADVQRVLELMEKDRDFWRGLALGRSVGRPPLAERDET